MANYGNIVSMMVHPSKQDRQCIAYLQGRNGNASRPLHNYYITLLWRLAFQPKQRIPGS